MCDIKSNIVINKKLMNEYKFLKNFLKFFY